MRLKQGEVRTQSTTSHSERLHENGICCDDHCIGQGDGVMVLLIWTKLMERDEYERVPLLGFHHFFTVNFTWMLPSLVAQRLKRLPAVRETWVRSLGWQDPLEKEMATHSSILVWRIPWTEEPGRSTGSQRVGHDWVTSLTHSHSPEVNYISFDFLIITVSETAKMDLST